MDRGYRLNQYDPAKSRDKAWKQSLVSAGLVVLTALTTWFLSAEGVAAVTQLLPAAAIPVLQWLAVFWLDRQKHKDED